MLVALLNNERNRKSYSRASGKDIKFRLCFGNYIYFLLTVLESGAIPPSDVKFILK